MHALDLESGKQILGDRSPLQEQLDCSEDGLRCWAHPLGTFFPPSLTELRLAVRVIQKTRETGIYVHCAKGVDRTGMVIAAFRILVEEWDPFDAAAECFREGMHWIYLPWLLQLWRLK